MCLSSPKPPPPPDPPPPPPPPPASTAETMADAGSATAKQQGYVQRAKRKGTKSLKIRLASNVGGGSGSNVGY
jgi:hypothetical protein